MTSQKKSTRQIVFRDNMGITHTCHKVGQKRTVKFDRTNGSIEDALIATISDEFNDSSIRPEVTTVMSLNNMNVYVVRGCYCFYIARPHFNGSVEIFSNGIVGFPIEYDYIYHFEAHGNIVVFWMCDKYTKMPIGHYNYVK